MPSNRLVIGICAHVDAGKTTLAEGMLYTCGKLRKLGRVDHKDAFLDNFALERARGITIFSKQAQMHWEGWDITLLDTPGHVDFSAEMERTLQVMDYCILVISGADGVQGHVQTLWKLLKQYHIPVILFVNKMDQPGADREALLRELQQRLDGNCVEFSPDILKQGEEIMENLSLCSEELMGEYLDTGMLSVDTVAEAIRDRKLFPCFFGAALHLQGVRELLQGIREFALPPKYGPEFGARVYKISRDGNGNRLTHLKVTGGALKVKMTVDNRASAANAEDAMEEKADQIRIYGGVGYETVNRVEAGSICTVVGFKKTFAGQGLGFESGSRQPVLVPVLTYQVILPEGTDLVKALGQMRLLEEEEPLLQVVWKEALGEIHVQVMGEIQIEILKSLLSERFGLEAEFGSGSIVYKETIASAVEGIGHFEPLRHYAEVHLLMEPGERGSGLQFASACSVDELDLNWQRLVLTHLEEKTHLGVLTGSPITDMKITLIAGRAHQKHTEGGDFRQATYRALRQGLMQCESILLEPVFHYTLEVPAEQLGRAMSDIQKMHGSFENPVTEGEHSILTGSVPAATAGDYQREVNTYTRGNGRFSCTLKGYEPCHNTEEVLAAIGYDPDKDLENPSSSVFCAHGAGFQVEWQRVPEYAHVESGRLGLSEKGNESEAETVGYRPVNSAHREGASGSSDHITQEEIEEIFKRTYGKDKQDFTPYRYHGRKTASTVYGEGQEAEKRREKTEKEDREYKYRPMQKREEYLLVDGYNIIFAWEDLRSLSEVNIDSARDRLMDICSNYQGYMGATLILVFDAYKVKGNVGSVMKYHNIYVVYTKEAETADQYIEKTVHKMAGKANVTVATSDRLEQMIIWGEGAMRLSAGGFREAVDAAQRQMREDYPEKEKVFSRICLPEGEK